MDCDAAPCPMRACQSSKQAAASRICPAICAKIRLPPELPTIDLRMEGDADPLPPHYPAKNFSDATSLNVTKSISASTSAMPVRTAHSCPRWLTGLRRTASIA